MESKVNISPIIDQEFKNFVFSKSPKKQARILENAARAGEVETIQKLFALNVDPNVTSGDYKWGALTVACQNNQLEAAVALLNGGADSAYALKQMIFESKIDCVEFLLDQKADPNNLSSSWHYRFSPLKIAAENKRDKTITQLLINHGADILQQESYDPRHSPLESAILSHDIEILNVMLPHYKTVHGDVFYYRSLRLMATIMGENDIREIFEREGIQIKRAPEDKCVLY